MPLSLVLNGQNRTFPDLPQPSTLDRLVSMLGLQGDRVAVEHNGEIVPRGQWSSTPLAEGDRLEVVHFVGGGSGLRCVPPSDLPAGASVHRCTSVYTRFIFRNVYSFRKSKNGIRAS